MRDSLDRGQYRGRQAEWDKLELPIYTVGNWSGMGLHLRGNTEAFVRAKSKHKKLRIHAGTHYHPFYAEEARRDQLRFFDHWLKGRKNGVMNEPPVKLLIRTGGGKDYQFRYENEWPLKRTQWTKFFLRPVKQAPRRGEPAEGDLATRAPAKRAAITYPASAMSKAGGRLGVMDLDRARRQPAAHGRVVRDRSAACRYGNHRPGQPRAVGVEHLRGHGHLRHHPQYRSGRQGRVGSRPAAAAGAGGQGLAARVAPQARPRRSRPYRPWHTHDERWLLKPGEIVRVEVEIWPTCMVFGKGHRIRLDIQPRDGVGSRAVYALQRRLQFRQQYRLHRRRHAVAHSAAGDPAEIRKSTPCHRFGLMQIK